MKRAYSDFTYPDLVKRASRERMPASMARRFFESCIKSLNLPPWYNKDSQFENILECELACHDGAATHLFIDRGLFDWLVDRSPDVDPDPDWMLELVEMREYHGRQIESPVVVHISGGNSPCFIILADPEGKMRFMVSHSTPPDDVEKVYELALKFTRGLAAYCRCFPGVIANGVPDDLKHAPRYKGQSRTARLHHDIGGGGVTPHFRCGHFRRLTSDQFTKKRGQIVFVRDTFVKGSAKHVDNVVDNETAARSGTTKGS